MSKPLTIQQLMAANPRGDNCSRCGEYVETRDLAVACVCARCVHALCQRPEAIEEAEKRPEPVRFGKRRTAGNGLLRASARRMARK